MASLLNPVDIPLTMDSTGTLGPATFEIAAKDAFDLLDYNQIVLQVGVLGITAGGGVTLSVDFLTSMQNDNASAWATMISTQTYTASGYTTLTLPSGVGNVMLRYFRIKASITGGTATFTMKGIARMV